MGANLTGLLKDMLVGQPGAVVALAPDGHSAGGEELLQQRVNRAAEERLSEWAGDLYLPMGESILYLSLWPRVVALERTAPESPWVPFEPHLDIDAELIDRPRHEPGARLCDWVPEPPEMTSTRTWTRRAFQRIPEGVRRAVTPFRFGQWRLLALAAACPAAVDLMHANPALAWMLASRLARKAADPEAAADLDRCLSLRQRDLAAALGFPRTEAAARLLRKIPARDCTRAAIHALRKLIREDRIPDTLRHMPELPAVVVLAAAQPAIGPLLSGACLHQIAEAATRRGRARRGHPAALLHDTAFLVRALPDIALPDELRSLGAVLRLHDDRMREYILRRYCHPELALPPPPIPAAPGIEPLTTARDVVAESVELHHCLASYIRRIRARHYYAYRVSHPARTTLGIRRTRSGFWHIDQIRGACNTAPPAALHNYVTIWFEKNCPRTVATTPGRDQLLLPIHFGATLPHPLTTPESASAATNAFAACKE